MYVLLNELNEVLEIKEAEIVNNNPNMKVVRMHTPFKEGDELNYFIMVTEITENNVVSMYSAVKQNPYVKELLTKNAELKAQQDLTNKAIEELILGGAL